MFLRTLVVLCTLLGALAAPAPLTNDEPKIRDVSANATQSLENRADNFYIQFRDPYHSNMCIGERNGRAALTKCGSNNFVYTNTARLGEGYAVFPGEKCLEVQNGWIYNGAPVYMRKCSLDSAGFVNSPSQWLFAQESCTQEKGMRVFVFVNQQGTWCLDRPNGDPNAYLQLWECTTAVSTGWRGPWQINANKWWRATTPGGSWVKNGGSTQCPNAPTYGR